MPTIAICSMFRDSQIWHGHEIKQVDKFFYNTIGQSSIDDYDKEYFLVEGNSQDDTYDRLMEWKKNLPAGKVNIYKHDIHGSEVASIQNDKRFKNLAECGNIVLRAARDSGAKYVFWMESDLIPTATTLSSLLAWAIDDDGAQWESTLGIAPIPAAGKAFYDVWAYRGINGEVWNNGGLEELKKYPHTLRVLSSFGSCALLNGDALRAHSLDFGEGCFPELCRKGREAGLNLYCDVSLEVQHPCQQLVVSRLI